MRQYIVCGPKVENSVSEIRQALFETSAYPQDSMKDYYGVYLVIICPFYMWHFKYFTLNNNPNLHVHEMLIKLSLFSKQINLGGNYNLRE